MNRQLEPDRLKRLVRDVLSTRPDEMTCDECLDRLDRFVEITIAGKDAASAMPLVQQHLEQCKCCREEFEALLSVLRTLS